MKLSILLLTTLQATLAYTAIAASISLLPQLLP